jgi:hypothetical protein
MPWVQSPALQKGKNSKTKTKCVLRKVNNMEFILQK